jgi:segregation and condensation protein B
MSQKERVVEAVLFAAGNRISVKRIGELAQIDSAAKVISILKKLQEQYDSMDLSFTLVDYGEEWKMTVKNEFLPVVEKIAPDTEFPKSVVETLAILAWKSPVLQSDLVKIRSTKVYDHIAELKEKGFVVKERVGRSFVVKLTPKFYEYFDMDKKTVSDAFKEFEDKDPLDQKKVDADYEAVQAAAAKAAAQAAKEEEIKRQEEIEELKQKPPIAELKAEEQKSRDEFLEKIDKGLETVEADVSEVVSDLKETVQVEREKTDLSLEHPESAQEIIEESLEMDESEDESVEEEQKKE